MRGAGRAFSPAHVHQRLTYMPLPVPPPVERCGQLLQRICFQACTFWLLGMFFRGHYAGPSASSVTLAGTVEENPQEKLLGLARHIDVPALTRACRRLRKDAAVGVDGVTVESYGEALGGNLQVEVACQGAISPASPGERLTFNDFNRAHPVVVPRLRSVVFVRAPLAVRRRSGCHLRAPPSGSSGAEPQPSIATRLLNAPSTGSFHEAGWRKLPGLFSFSGAPAPTPTAEAPSARARASKTRR